jgi:hypothetical protein
VAKDEYILLVPLVIMSLVVIESTNNYKSYNDIFLKKKMCNVKLENLMNNQKRFTIENDERQLNVHIK